MSLQQHRATTLDLAKTGSEAVLPISTQEVLAGLDSKRALELDRAYGNASLIEVVRILGMAGPFTAVTPWELEDEQGVRRINAGSYAASPLGEQYPPLLEFIETFLRQNRSMHLPQQAVSEWRAALAANLVSLLASVAPSHADSQVFFANSGAEAIETAIKFVKAARPEAKYLINFTRGYHGKTYGALSLTPNDEYQAPFRPLMPFVKTLPYGDMDAFEDAVLELGPDTIAGVVLEPIQGEAGVIVPPQDFLSELGKLCQRHGILVVADEIQTGLGRSGYWFASIEWGGLEPDIITLAKPLGGGIMPVSATIARRDIYQKMLGGLLCKSHSTTMGGNALGMAIGLKSLEILVENNLAERSRQLGERGLARLQEIQQRYPQLLAEVRGFGMLLALQYQLVLNPKLAPKQAALIGELSGFLGLRSLHLAGVQANASFNAMRTVRLTPALNMPEELFDDMLNRVEEAAASQPRAWRMLTGTPLGALSKLGNLALRG